MIQKLLMVVLFGLLALVAVYGYFKLPQLTRDFSESDQVVLLHGLGRTEAAMLAMERQLSLAGYEVHNIGYPSWEKGPEALVAYIGAEVDACCAGSGRPLHFVGHSLGGLLIRAYLGARQPDNLHRVVLLGAPNHGSELADGEVPLTEVLVETAGPAAQALGTGPEDFPASLLPPSYPVGVIAGNRSGPFVGDLLPFPNDGMVSVESARLEGMKDFIELPLTHWELRSNGTVADQVIEFLRNGRFAR